MLKSISFVIVLFLLILTQTLLAADYRPELSGSYESGERSFLDSEQGDDPAELLDKYYYSQLWLNYRQKLSPKDYYYLKVQNYQKDYLEKDSYDNNTNTLWFNYTHQLNDKLRNKYLLTYRDKNYQYNQDNDYQLYRIKYQLNYKYNERMSYIMYYQRQWTAYQLKTDKNNICDRLSFSCDYQVNESLEINTTMDFDRELFNQPSDSSNKEGKSLAVGFKLKL